MLKKVCFEERTIGSLKEITFEIPSYQRGYRWERTQVKNLLDDIKQYYDKDENSNKNYYLQPIIIKKKEDQKYILIDGQQRLTTIYMIISYLLSNSNISNEIYNIEYETIKETTDSNDKINLQKKISEYIEDLKNGTKNKKFNSLNEYYYNFAIEYIDEWYEKSNLKDKKLEFLRFIKEKVKVIWYELEDTNKENENETFIRINTNKIKLTQADLVKAEFLRKDKKREETKNLLELGKEWDEIENKLFNEKFWYFISNKETKDRMTELLNITMKVNYPKTEDEEEKDENEIYNTFQKQIDGSRKGHINTWQDIVKIFNILNEWYEDIELYNIIGYIIMLEESKSNKNITEWIVKAIENYTKSNEINTKEEFKQKFLKEEIKSNVFNQKIWKEMPTVVTEKDIKENLQSLNYYDNKNEIKNILILHNILTLNNLKENKIRFAFDKYKNTYDKEGKKISWDIEHIHSQHEKSIENDEDKNDYINYLRIYYINEYIKNAQIDKEDKNLEYIKNKLIKIDNLRNEPNDKIKKRAEKEGLEIKENFELDSIGNLALLDSKTNRSYGNSLFMKKRAEIIEKDEKRFIPICTRKAFLKAFLKNKEEETKNEKDNTEQEEENNIMQFFEWNSEDEKIYVEDITSKLYNEIFR